MGGAYSGIYCVWEAIFGDLLGVAADFEGSEEEAVSKDELVKGLGILPGKVVRFEEEQVDERLKVPQMGWNGITWERNDPLYAGLSQNAYVYFVHSYYVKPTETEEEPITSAVAEYGAPFTASVWKDNVWATQFHPEKSQRVGLQILKNFADF